MTSSELGEFLYREQHLTLDSQQLQSLVEKYEISTAKQEGLLTLAGNEYSWIYGLASSNKYFNFQIIIFFIKVSMC